MSTIGLNSNISALRTQRYLDGATRDLAGTFARLSSGLRVSKASDDAAGLAVADSLRNQSRLYGAAARNINDGISAINIATGTLSNQATILQRMLELAEQSANGVYTSQQRSAMQAEYAQLAAEFGRQGDTTSFNGVSLLRSGRGSSSSLMTFQAGISGAAASQVTVSLADTAALSGTIREGQAFGNGVTFLSYGQETLENLLAESTNLATQVTFNDNTGRSRTVYLTISYQTFSNDYAVNLWAKNSDLGATGEVLPDTESFIGNASNYTRLGETAFSVNSQTGKVSGSGEISLAYVFDAVAGSGGAFAVNGNLNLDLGGLTFLAHATPSVMQILTTSDSGVTAIDFTGVETSARALSALTVLNTRLSEVNSIIGQFGAAQSRLAASLNVVNASKDNTATAEGRIRDADIGHESAQLVAQQIRQQASAQVLSLAAQQPQLVLSLLR